MAFSFPKKNKNLSTIESLKRSSLKSVSNMLIMSSFQHQHWKASHKNHTFDICALFGGFLYILYSYIMHKLFFLYFMGKSFKHGRNTNKIPRESCDYFKIQKKKILKAKTFFLLNEICFMNKTFELSQLRSGLKQKSFCVITNFQESVS